MVFEHLLHSIEDGIARLKLNRPAALNALSRPLLGEMITVLDGSAGYAEGARARYQRRGEGIFGRGGPFGWLFFSRLTLI